MNEPARAVEHLTAVEGKRSIAVWRMAGGAPDPPIAFVAPGFTRRMRHMAPVALYLAANGFTVYRCDYLDHVGLSDGDVYDTTITSMYESQRATLDLITECEKRPPVVVAASLANRTAVRLAARSEHVAGLIGIVGVV